MEQPPVFLFVMWLVMWLLIWICAGAGAKEGSKLLAAIVILGGLVMGFVLCINTAQGDPLSQHLEMLLGPIGIVVGFCIPRSKSDQNPA